MKYQRVLLKLSGEALAGAQGYGIHRPTLATFVAQIKEVYQQGVQISLVIGGGNIHRGASGAGRAIDRVSSDQMGMLATVINALAFGDALQKAQVPSLVLSAVEMPKICESYQPQKALQLLHSGNVLLFAGGTGNPFFTTDTTAALRASEMEAQVLLKATKVDGVYDQDPLTNPQAKKFDRLAFLDVLSQQLQVMDAAAVSLCMENKVDIVVFDIFRPGNLLAVIRGEKVGTLISNGQ